MPLLGKIAKKGLSFIAQKSGLELIKKIGNDFEYAVTELTGIKPLNIGEEEIIENREYENIMHKNVSQWSQNDMRKVMKNSKYSTDEKTRAKVRRYFEYKYPEN